MEVEKRPTRFDSGVIVALAGLVCSVVLTWGFLSLYGDATGFLWLPEADPELVAYIEGLIGPSVVAPDQGHDGKFFFLQANDPLLLNPEEGFTFFDWPAYRAQRMLYPLIAGGFGLLPPGLIVWSLIVVNVLSMALGTWALSRLARGLGASQWLGLAFVLNPGNIFELSIDGGSILGLALALWGLAAFERGRWIAGSVLLSGAVLARETLALMAIGAFVYLWRRDRVVRWDIVLLPGICAGLWQLWVRSRVGESAGSAVAANVGVPLEGLIEGVQNWFISGGLNLALGALVVLCAGVVLWYAISRPSLLTWSVVGFVPLLLILDSDVVRGGLNITRAVAPILSVGMLLVLKSKKAMPPVFSEVAVNGGDSIIATEEEWR